MKAYARGYADGQLGRDSPPYHQIDEKALAAAYEQGRLDAELDDTPKCRSVPAAPIRAKTGK